MNGSTVVSVKNVKKSFYLPHQKNDSLKRAITQVFKSKKSGGETFSALDGISFNVEKGDFFGILGRNGSGKSTLLKIISQIYQPTSGSVSHSGKVVSFIELGVGFKPELTGRENVFLNGALLGFSKEEVADMYDEIVSFAELEKFMDQKLKNYSSGMKVRLAFSVAIRAHADILILDEVLAVGDAAFQRKCNDYFKTLKEDGKTVILVTHSMGAVRDFCNKAVLIENGKIIHQGEADNVADEYLKLFAPKQEYSVETDDREGNQLVKISDVSCDNTDGIVSVALKLQSKIAKTVYLAIDVNRDGVLVGGLSSHNNPSKQIQLDRDEKIDVNVSFKCSLGRGLYSVSIGVKDPDTHEIYDLRSNIEEFRVKDAYSAYLPVIFDEAISVNR